MKLIKTRLFWAWNIFAICSIIIVLIFIFRNRPEPVQQVQDLKDSIALNEYKAKISVLSDANAILTGSIRNLYDSLERVENNHKREIKAIRKLSMQELAEERLKYIEPGTDSSELVQEIGYYKELDHCQEQGMVKDEIIKQQSIKIENLETINTQHEQTEQIYLSMIDRRDATIEDIQKRHKKELRRVKWAAGGVVVFMFGLGFIAL